MAILKADPEYRRRVLWLYLAGVVAGFGLLLWAPPLLVRHLAPSVRARDPAGAVRLLQVLVALLFVPGLPLAYYLYRLAGRIHASGQFPPPGTRVLRDTVVVEGVPAHRRANQVRGLSVLLAVLSLVGIVVLPYLVGKIVPAMPPTR
jgi:hypothetical protein